VTVAGAAETANVACGGDMCASEVQDASQAVQEVLPAVEEAAPKLEEAAESGITVLGRMADVARYKDIAVNKLYDPSMPPMPDFWEKINRPFLDAAMRRGDTFVLVSKYVEGGKNFFTTEVEYLIEKGYDKVIYFEK